MSARPSILVWGDEILDPVRRLLRQVPAKFDDLSSRATAEDIERSYGLVVMSLAQALELEAAESQRGFSLPGKPVRVVVHNQDFLPLRDRLRRVGVDFLVQSSVDPGVLRLLVLHALFQGPEKRSAPRLLVGSRVSYAVHDERSPATLVDVSEEGCRLLSAAGVPFSDTPVTVVFPADLAGGKPLELRGRALRVAPEPGGEADRQFAVTFDTLDAASARRFRTVLAGKTIGTLVTRLADSVAGRPARRAPRALATGRRPAPKLRETRRQSADAVAEPERAALPPEGKSESITPPERRLGTRVAYSNIVTLLIGDDTRILLGRDLSRVGVRVEPGADLSVGQALLVAIYGAVRTEPLLIPAVVARDDGEHGQLLRFDQAAGQLLSELERILAAHGERGTLSRLDAAGGPVVIYGPRAREDHRIR